MRIDIKFANTEETKGTASCYLNEDSWTADYLITCSDSTIGVSLMAGTNLFLDAVRTILWDFRDAREKDSSLKFEQWKSQK